VRTIESETLANPFSILEGPGGAVFISDPLAEGLFRISSENQWLKFARDGEGPGELKVFGGLGLCGDTVLAVDPGSRSLVLFSSSGEFIDELTIDVAALTSVYPMSFPAVLVPGGGIVTVPAVPPGEVSAGRLKTVPYLGFDRDGLFQDTVLVEDVAGTFALLDTPTGFKPSVRQFFRSRPNLVLDRRGTFAARLEETEMGLRITWIDLASRQETAREWDLHRKPLEPSGWNVVLDRWAEANSERLTLPPARIRTLLDDVITVPGREPLFTEAIAGSGGAVWLRGFSTSDEVAWSRFSVDHPSPVIVTLPAEDEVMDAGGEWLWVLRRDILDVPRLVKLRLGGSQLAGLL
jgi:hypothetical protein